MEVNYHEAKAFCNWKCDTCGQLYRLPTEDEWYRLYAVPGLDEVADDAIMANLHLRQASARPVNTYRHGELYDVVGNVWQWTETPIYPFDGFAVHPLYDDFITPTFDTQHNLFKGGSWISSGNETRNSARYVFRRHFFQHAGYRYVVSAAAAAVPASHYETDKLLSEYAEFHYGDCYFDVPNFSQALARHFAHVTRVDFSARFIGMGVQMAQQSVLRYALADEGDLVEFKQRTLHELELEGVQHKVEFLQGDACNLKPNLSGYDLILAANLIDRLYRPRQFLAEVHQRLNVGGILLLASPYTWLVEHTPRADWMGGYKRDGETVIVFIQRAYARR